MKLEIVLTTLLQRPAVRLGPALLSLVGASLLVGCSQEGKIARHTSRADAYFAEGEYDKARLEYLNVIQLDPRNTHAAAQLGHIFFENGIVLPAGAAMDQALKLGATDPLLRVRLGTLLAAAGRVEEAREHARQALQTDPALEDALFLLADLANDDAAATDLGALLGRLRAQKGSLPAYDAAEAVLNLKRRDLTSALALADKALAASPGSGAAQFVMAGVYLAQSNFVAGGTAFARAAELSPPRSTRQIQYVNFLLQRGNTNEALARLEKLIEAAPDFVPARMRRAQWSFAQGDSDAVMEDIDAVLIRDRSNPDARLLAAQVHLARREPAKADEVMQELIRQFPNSGQLQYQAALTSIANQKPNEAQLRLDRAYELSPGVPEVVILRGRLYLARGQAGEVIASMQRLIATNATVRLAYQLLGDAFAASGDLDRSLAVFRDYERRFANDPIGPQSLGLLHLRRRERALASAAFERALAIRKDFLPAVEQIVLLDLAATNAPVAIERARRYVDQVPETAEGRVLLAQALLANRQPELAERELERAIELKPSLQPAYLLLARLYQESNRRDAAIQQLEALLKEEPGERRALMMLGILQTSAGAHQRAAESYEKLLQHHASFSPALNNLAYLYSEHLGNLDRAYELARKCRELQPDDPRVADTMGWILYRRGDYSSALVHLEESAGRLPREAEVFYHLGMAHYALAHETAARTAFQQALNLEPAASWRSDVDDRLVVLDAGTGGDEATLKRFEQLSAARPSDVILQARFARALEAAGQLDRALAGYKKAAMASPGAFQPLIGQARVIVAQGDAQAGLSLARKARELAKNDSAALFELGRIGYQARDFPWSYALLQEAAAGSPSGSLDVQFAFAQAAIAVGRLEVARSALERVVAASRSDRAALQLELIPACLGGSVAPVPEAVARRLASLATGELLADLLKARQLAADNRVDQALPALEAILSAYPQFTPARRSLATLLVVQPGRLEQAEKLAREVRETQPDDAEMARVLGIAAFGRKDYRYAADLLNEASRNLASDGELFLFLGRARARNNQLAEARQALNRALSLPLTEPQKRTAQLNLQELDQ